MLQNGIRRGVTCGIINPILLFASQRDSTMKLTYLIAIFAAIITSHQVSAVRCTSSVTCLSLGCANGGHVCESAICQNGVCVGLVCARVGMECPVSFISLTWVSEKPTNFLSVIVISGISG